MPQPVSSNNTPIESGELSKEDVIDLLAEEVPAGTEAEAEGAQDKDKTPVKGKKPAEKENKDKKDDLLDGEEEEKVDDEEEEVDEEEKIPEPEELDLVTPVRRKEILAKYPNLFKDFPYLQQAYYREQQYTEVFATIDDAKEASQKAGVLDSFESDLMQGNIAKVLTAVKAGDGEAFNRLADNYLQELGKVDKEAVHHVIGNILKNSIINVYNQSQGMGENGEQLRDAAILFHQAIFGTQQITAPTNLAKKSEDDPEKAKLAEERKEFIKQRFEVTRDTLNTKVNNSIKSTISNHIDPKNSMPDYVRKNATRDAQENLESLMGQDARFSQLIDKLWEKAFETNFSQKSIDQLRSTFLSKARTLLPSVIAKARNEALKSSGSRDSKDQKDRKGPLPVGRQSTSSSSEEKNAKSPAQEIPKGIKTLDFLNSE